jgi:hypothetical protein
MNKLKETTSNDQWKPKYNELAQLLQQVNDARTKSDIAKISQIFFANAKKYSLHFNIPNRLNTKTQKQRGGFVYNPKTIRTATPTPRSTPRTITLKRNQNRKNTLKKTKSKTSSTKTLSKTSKLRMRHKI